MSRSYKHTPYCGMQKDKSIRNISIEKYGVIKIMTKMRKFFNIINIKRKLILGLFVIMMKLERPTFRNITNDSYIYMKFINSNFHIIMNLDRQENSVGKSIN